MEFISSKFSIFFCSCIRGLRHVPLHRWVGVIVSGAAPNQAHELSLAACSYQDVAEIGIGPAEYTAHQK